MRICTLLFLFVFSSISVAQTLQDSIYSKFNNYLKLPESSVYLHLNKSVLVSGEDLGFTAYVYDRKNERPAVDVRNLYCQLLDSDKKVVKEKLLLVKDGKAIGKFAVDSLVPSGDYSVKAFTNWMKNFKDPHFYQAPVKIVSLTDKELSTANSYNLKADVSVEGGSLIQNISSVIVVKAQMSNGNPASGSRVQLFENNTILIDKTTNELGIVKFTLAPKKNKQYVVSIAKNGQQLNQPLPMVEQEGFALRVKESTDSFYVNVNTNDRTLNKFKDQDVTIVVNSLDTLQIFTSTLENKETTLNLKKETLKEGAHQVTLFSESGKRWNNRLFYHQIDRPNKNIPKVYISKSGDSLKTNILLENVKSGSLSVSVLPATAISVDPYQRIKSHFKLNNYVNTPFLNKLEKAYSKKKRDYRLDNLLISSNASIYDWDLIMKDTISFKNEFETGITLIANVQSQKQREFVVYGGEKNTVSTIQLEDGKENFTLSEYFPVGEDRFEVSSLNKKGKGSKAAIYPQFFPNQVPSFSIEKELYTLNVNSKIPKLEYSPFLPESEKLDEITIITQKEEKRKKEIYAKAKGPVIVLTDKDRKREFNMLQFLSRNGYQVIDRNNQLSIIPPGPLNLTSNSATLAVDWDGLFTLDLNILRDVSMEIVDYVDLDRSGSGISMGVPTLIIRTDPLLNPNGRSKNSLSSYDVPLTFDKYDTFKKPLYYNYNDEFFKTLGVVNWLPEVSLIDGKASFTMENVDLDELLFHIQGWTDDGELIDEVIKVNVDKNP